MIPSAVACFRPFAADSSAACGRLLLVLLVLLLRRFQYSRRLDVVTITFVIDSVRLLFFDILFFLGFLFIGSNLDFDLFLSRFDFSNKYFLQINLFAVINLVVSKITILHYLTGL